MATLAKLLQVDMGLPEMAKRLAAAGRSGDTILAHINPREAKLLKSRGGSGKINPATGIMEFAYGEDDNAGEEEAYQYLQDQAAAEPVQSYAPAAQDPAQRQQTQSDVGPPISFTAPAYDPSEFAPVAPPQFQTPRQVGSTPGGSAPPTPAGLTPQQPGFMDKLKSVTQGASDLNQALQPLAPLARLGMAGAGAYQANQQSQKAQQQAAVNEAEIRKLAEPYRQQGQQLMALGQGGGLTAPQVQALEVQRAQAKQQQANAGVTGGTASQQTEAMLQRQASIYAQDNVNQGLKLMNVADDYIKSAISTGYLQSKDAMAISSDFFKQLGLMFPDATSQANAAPK
jgi:hypothetical protein